MTNEEKIAVIEALGTAGYEVASISDDSRKRLLNDYLGSSNVLKIVPSAVNIARRST